MKFGEIKHPVTGPANLGQIPATHSRRWTAMRAASLEGVVAARQPRGAERVRSLLAPFIFAVRPSPGEMTAAVNCRCGYQPPRILLVYQDVSEREQFVTTWSLIGEGCTPPGVRVGVPVRTCKQSFVLIAFVFCAEFVFDSIPLFASQSRDRAVEEDNIREVVFPDH